MAKLLSLDAKQLNFAAVQLKDIPNGLVKATQGAINTSLTQARRDFYEAIKRDYALQKTASRHKEAVSMVRASPNRLAGALKYTGLSIPLINFKVTPNRPLQRRSRGVRVTTEVQRGNPKIWNHAFIARMKSGHVGVFERVGGKRYPIRQLYSTNIPSMINRVEQTDPELRNRLQRISEIKLNEQILRLLNKVQS